MKATNDTVTDNLNRARLHVLVRAIAAHGFHGFVRDGRLYGVMTYANGPDTTEEIQATVAAVMAWLGY